MRNKLLKIFYNYSESDQLKKLNEEMFELIEAIMLYKPENKAKSTDNITEEMADVMVMLEQFRLAYNIELEDIEKIMKYKIDRQLERIENE